MAEYNGKISKWRYDELVEAAEKEKNIWLQKAIALAEDELTYYTFKTTECFELQMAIANAKKLSPQTKMNLIKYLFAKGEMDLIPNPNIDSNNIRKLYAQNILGIKPNYHDNRDIKNSPEFKTAIKKDATGIITAWNNMSELTSGRAGIFVINNPEKRNEFFQNYKKHKRFLLETVAVSISRTSYGFEMNLLSKDEQQKQLAKYKNNHMNDIINNACQYHR